MSALWSEDGWSAVLLDEAGDYAGTLYPERWYQPGKREPDIAWIVEYIRDGEMLAGFVCPAVEQPDVEQRSDLGARAFAVMAADPRPVLPPEPPESDFTHELDLLLAGWGEAHQRLHAAAQRSDEHARALIYLALSELLHWTCSFDHVLTATWNRFPRAYRETISVEIDAAVDASEAQNRAQAAAHGHVYIEPPAAIFAARRQRAATGLPYPKWSQALAIKQLDLDPRFLLGLHWIRGKFFHRGAVHAVDLRQWRPGAEPRWKWLTATATGQSTEVRGGDIPKLRAYEGAVAGRDVLGSLNLGGELLESVWLFSRLYHERP